MSVKEKDAQVRDYYRTYKQWNVDADNSYRQRQESTLARAAASGGGVNQHVLDAQTKEYEETKAGMRKGEHFRQLKDAWTNGYKYNREELPAGAMEVARSRVESKLTEQGYKQGFREVADEFGDGPSTTEEYWLKDGAKKQRTFDGENFSEDYMAKDYADFRGLIDKEYKALAADDDAMFGWMEERYGSGKQGSKETESEAVAVANGPTSPSGGAPSGVEGSWTMGGGVEDEKKQNPWI
jgi:hypothetical protein